MLHLLVVKGIRTGSSVTDLREVAVNMLTEKMTILTCLHYNEPPLLHRTTILIFTTKRAWVKLPEISNKMQSSVILRTCNLWNHLPSSCCPESYNLSSIKSKINKLDLLFRILLL